VNPTKWKQEKGERVGYSILRVENEEKPTYTEELFTKVPAVSTIASLGNNKRIHG
jgi:hypothetical protein